MEKISNRSIVAVWAILVAATLVSVALSGNSSAHAGAVGILSIAFIKVYLVAQYFMEVGAAPKSLRIIMAGWCVGVWAVLGILCW